MLSFEADLWFDGSSARRRQAEGRFESVVSSLDGEIVRRALIPEISYHGVLGRIPVVHAAALVEHSNDHVLLLGEDLMFLRPAGQWTVPVVEELSTQEHELQADIDPGNLGSPVLALLDGLPLTGHNLLEGRLAIDDPDGYEEYYQAEERRPRNWDGVANMPWRVGCWDPYLKPTFVCTAYSQSSTWASGRTDGRNGA